MEPSDLRLLPFKLACQSSFCAVTHESYFVQYLFKLFCKASFDLGFTQSEALQRTMQFQQNKP